MDLTPEAQEAIHTQKNAQQAIEVAREASNAKLVEDTAQRTKEALLEGLKQVFSNDAKKTPKEMTVLFQRIPILCTSIIQMHEDIRALKDAQTWAMRIVVAAVITLTGSLLLLALKAGLHL